MELMVYVDGRATLVRRNDFGNFDEEASTLGLPVGVWPGRLEAVADGDRVWLHKGSNGGEGARSGAVAYVSGNGLTRLLVWND